MAEQVNTSDLPADKTQGDGAPGSATEVDLGEGKGAVSVHRQRIGFLGWKPDLPDFRDRYMTAPHPTAVAALPKAATLPNATTMLPPIRDQGDQGSCTGHSTRTAVQYKRAAEKKASLELSPRFIYFNARVIEGTVNQDAGAMIRDVIKGVNKLGVASEKLCPYSDKVLTQRPTSQAYKEALDDQVLKYERVQQNHDYVAHCIVSGNPIVIGMTVYESMMSDQVANNGLLPMPTADDGVDGGHAICVVAYDDTMSILGQKGGVLIANSWGQEWGCKGPNGTRGYFWMPWRYLLDTDLVDDLWSVDVVKEETAS
jgi:C1A family cysteine protease